MWLMWKRARLLVPVTLAMTFGFLWMLADVMYIELSGPRGELYASELQRGIGGGSSAGALAVFYALFVAAMLLLFSEGRLGELRREWAMPPERDRVLGVDVFAAGKVVLLLLVVGTYTELLRGGVPLLAGIDRGAFALQAGPIVGLLYRYEIYLCLMAGVLYVEDARRGHAGVRSVVAGCIGGLVLAYVMMGHKFSGIFFNLLLFAIPISLASLDGVHRFAWLTARRAVVAVGLGVLFTLTVKAYLTRFANSATLTYYLEQRLLIQQGELWWSAWDRVVEAGQFDPETARDAVFHHPVTETTIYTGNTSLTYLMYLERGSPVHGLFVNGYLFTGASPTILLELFGPAGGAAVWFLASLVYAWLLYLFLHAVVRRELIQAVFISFVFGLYHNVMVGGHMTEFASRSFWIKVVAMAGVMIVGREWRRFQGSGLSVALPESAPRATP